MLARDVVSYARPVGLAEALALTAAGGVPLAGGTRLLAAARPLGDVVDLGSLDLTGIRRVGGDLHVGALTTLQDLLESPEVHAGTDGLLTAACQAQQASRMLREMATLGGEAVFASPDSEVVAALLALNAIFVVTDPEGETEIPALRFLRSSAADLAGGRLLTRIVVPGRPGGAALERVAVLPSAPPLVAVAASLSFAGGQLTRARVAITGHEGPPARVLEAESRLEGARAEEVGIERYVQEALARAEFRDDAHASASYRRRVAEVLIRRSLHRASERAHRPQAVSSPRAWPRRPGPLPPAVPRASTRTVEATVNGRPVRGEASAGTSLIEWLRREGFWGVKHGCETGECGACTVLLDGRPVTSCLTLAFRAHGRRIETVEGLGTPESLHPVQEAFVDTGAIQCGYCTPAMELTAKALIEAIPDPTEAEVRDTLAGCLCRCTGYVKPVEAVLRAAERRRSR